MKSKYATIAQKFGTPIYVYDLNLIRKKAREMKAHLPKDCLIQYAMKANSNESILKCLRQEGLGLDVVSGGELKLGLKLKFRPDQIVFSGVGKTKSEIEFAVSKGIRSINIESFAELERVFGVAKALNKTARVSLRINPNVSARTHRHITTGRDFNKFGLSSGELRDSLQLLSCQRSSLNLIGLTFHLGSQIQSTAPYRMAVKKIEGLVRRIISDGFPLEHLSVGGGLAVRYREEKSLDLKNFGKFVKTCFRKLPVRSMCEPGRALVAEAGVLLTEVQYIKDTGKTLFAIVDTGMHHLIRPALYEAYHQIVPLQARRQTKKYEVVGPICESTDVLARERRLPALEAGDILAILNAGAYGRVMASEYNRHPLPREVILNGRRIK